AVDDLAHPRFARGQEDALGPEHIGAGAGLGGLDGGDDPRHGGEMEDTCDPGHGGAAGLRIGDIGPHERGRPRDPVAPAIDQAVEHAHPISLLEQRLDEMAADETGAAGDKDEGHVRMVSSAFGRTEIKASVDYPDRVKYSLSESWISRSR